MYYTEATMVSPYTYKRCNKCNKWYLIDGSSTSTPPLGFGTRYYAEIIVTCDYCVKS